MYPTDRCARRAQFRGDAADPERQDARSRRTNCSRSGGPKLKSRFITRDSQWQVGDGDRGGPFRRRWRMETASPGGITVPHRQIYR